MAITEIMQASAPDAAPIFVGEFRHAIDPKNRVTIPSRWRQAETEELVLTPNHNNECLVVYSPKEFAARWKKVAANPQFSEKAKAAFKRTFSVRARDGVVDKQGRMVLPQDLCKQVGIASEAILVGCMDEFQVWPPDRWEAARNKAQEDFEEIAGVMGL